MKQVLRRFLIAGLFVVVMVFAGCRRAGPVSSEGQLHIVVMDPLCWRLACDCVEGYAQRRYDLLGEFLEKELGRKITISYGEDLKAVLKAEGGQVDVIIGKRSVVLFDCERVGLKVRQAAMLSDKAGSVNLQGIFVVRGDDKAKGLADLEGYKILFGPELENEKSAAAMSALKGAGVKISDGVERKASCNSAGIAVAEGDADAAVISSYAFALLEGCSTIDKGQLREVGRTADVGFITVFVTEGVDEAVEEEIVDALLKVKKDKRLLKAMESRDGFIKASVLAVERKEKEQTAKGGWPDWRGAGRDAMSLDVPAVLPSEVKFLWRKKLTGQGPAGIAVMDGFVVLADKDKEKKNDIFRCLDEQSGAEIWKIKYPAEGVMDYSNSPRATPVIRGQLVYLLGAFGDLNCVKLATGEVVWGMNVVERFGAELIVWGMSSTPLVVGDKIIVNPGAEDAAIAALDRFTGEVIWKGDGEGSAYSSFITGQFGGVEQVVGYDAITIGGWDVETGRRLWTVMPEYEGDFNVPTLVDAGDRIVAVSENNGTRVYEFGEEGKIKEEPIWRNLDLTPDCSSPVVVDGLVFGGGGGLFCIGVEDGKTRWEMKDDEFYDYMALIGGQGRVLVITVEGELVLIETGGKIISRLKVFEKSEVWSHPALVGNKLYIRSQNEIACILLD